MVPQRTFPFHKMFFVCGKGFLRFYFRFLKNCSEELVFFGELFLCCDSLYNDFIESLFRNALCLKKWMLTWSATACFFYMFFFLIACVYIRITFIVSLSNCTCPLWVLELHACVAKNVISACEPSVCVWERERSFHAVISSVTESKHSHFS